MMATEEWGEARKGMKMADADAAGVEKKCEGPERHEKNYWSDLPPELITYIMSYLSVDDIVQCRMVCQSFNESGKYLLNMEASWILSEIETYLHRVSKNIPQTSDQWLNMRPRERELEDLKYIFQSFVFAYEVYVMDNTSSFVAGEILDLDYAMMVFNKSHWHQQCLLQLSTVLTRLKVLVHAHFISTIFPMIFERKNPSTTTTASQFDDILKCPCWVQALQPAKADKALSEHIIREQDRIIRERDQLIAMLTFLKDTLETVMEAQKLILALIKAKF